jgi:hypothetical protein
MVLLDVKTVMSVRDPARVGRWLWQLLGYAWLDPTDRYRIRDAGLYFARHGLLLTWPLPDLAAALLGPGRPAGPRDVDAAAEQFRRLAVLTQHVVGDHAASRVIGGRPPRAE